MILAVLALLCAAYAISLRTRDAHVKMELELQRETIVSLRTSLLSLQKASHDTQVAVNRAQQTLQELTHTHPTWLPVHHRACRTLHVSRLLQVRKAATSLGFAEPVAGREPSYRRGHYPYPQCSAVRHGRPKNPVGSLAVLMVASDAYRSVVPAWASHVQRAGAVCVLGNIGTEEYACSLAERLGCRGST